MSRRPLKLAMAVTALSLATVVVILVRMVMPSEEAVRIRNAFLAEPGTSADFRWAPTHVPAGFLQERSAVPDEFTDIAHTVLHSLPATATNLDKSLAIARHLMQGPGHGGAIMSNTQDAYMTMMTEGGGYCADFSQVFNGIALAAEIPVREWGMAFDGFGGDGHAFNEIYDDRLNQWVLIDSFYSLYFRKPMSGRPLSALDVRKLLRQGAKVNELEVVPIVPAEFGFKSGAKAIDYYRRGANQFYLWWGNNVFSYDAHPLVRLMGPISRSLEEGSAILAGVHPQIRIVETDRNSDQIRELMDKRNRFIMLVALAALLLPLLLLLALKYRIGRPVVACDRADRCVERPAV